MQSLEKRLTSLECAKAETRQLEHLTDAELDERIAALRARIAAAETGAASKEKHHAEH